MNARPLTHSEESRLISAVEQVRELTDQHMDPSEAVAKIARDQSLDDGEVKLLCTAFNTGRQLHQWEKGSAIEKLGSFRLADPAVALPRAYAPEPQAEKVAYEYAQPPEWLNFREAKAATVKSASTFTPPDRSRASRDPKRYELESAKIACDNAAMALEQANYMLKIAMSELQHYFRQPTSNRCSFPAFKEAVEAYAPNHTSVLEWVGQVVPAAEKQAKAGFDEKFELPLARVQDCRKIAAEVLRRTEVLAACESRLATAKAAMVRPLPEVPHEPAPPGPSIIPRNPFVRQKAASGLLSMPAVGSAIGSGLAQVGKAPLLAGEGPDAAAMVNKLNNPDLQAELRRIQVQATLTRLMADDDDPISGYDPGKVVDTFNEISQLAPQVTTQPAALGPILRKQLAGRFEPFETAQVLGIDKDLQARNQPRPQLAGGKPGG